MLRSLPLLLLLSIAPTPAKDPVRLLVLMGGEHHKYEANMKALLEGLKGRGLDFTAELIRIDAPRREAGRRKGHDREQARPPEGPQALRALRRDHCVHPGQLHRRARRRPRGRHHQLCPLRRRMGGNALRRPTPSRVGPSTCGWWAAASRPIPRSARSTCSGSPPRSPWAPGSRTSISTMSSTTCRIAPPTTRTCYWWERAPATARPARSPGPNATEREGFRTALGHGPDTYKNPNFLTMLQQAIEWAAARENPSDLFNGRDLDGWTMTGPGDFAVDATPGHVGELVSSGGMGLCGIRSGASRTSRSSSSGRRRARRTTRGSS